MKTSDYYNIYQQVIKQGLTTAICIKHETTW